MRGGYPRPLPVADPDSEAFWDACRQHRLIVQQCDKCQTLRFAPSPMCHRCWSWEFSWQEQPGTGTVHSWIVARTAVVPGFADEVPYITALVEVAEGIRIPSRLIGVAPENVRPGLPVRVVFHDVTDDVTLPFFAPAAEG